MILPRLETQPELREFREARAEHGVSNQMRRNGAGGELADPFIAIPGDALADAAEAPAAGGDFGLQHTRYAATEPQVGVADDALGDATGTVVARRAHRGDAVDELD